MMKKTLKKLFPVLDERGVAHVEFALVLPVLMILLLTGIEVGRYTFLHLKMQHASFVMGDIVSRDASMTNCTLDGLFGAIQHATKPFEFEDNGTVIVSGVSKQEAENNPKVRWQATGAGNLSATSAVGSPVNNADLPDGFTLQDDQSILVVELYFQTEPWLLGFVPQTVIDKTTYYRPRLGSIESFQSGIECT